MRRRFVLRISLSALLVAQAVPAHADGVLPQRASPVQREQAQARFLRGKDLMSKRNQDGALAEFSASHDIVASPNTRLEAARCLLAMGRLVAGYAELGRVVVEAKELLGQDNRYQRALDAATAERAEIEPKLGFVSLAIGNAADDTRVTVAGEEIRRAAWDEPTPVQAGATEIAVSTPGREPIKRTVTLAAGQRSSLSIDARSGEPNAPEAPPPAVRAAPPPRAATGGWMRPGGYVAGGLGVAGLATFAILGLMARSTYDDLNSACAGGPCPAWKAGEISSGKATETIANVGLTLGLVGAAAGVPLFILSSRRDGGLATTGLVVSPAWVGVRGSL